ncbi:hypothetical protein [Ruegeria sp.]|uniref:hypothetical protein n=1 Tax=Ruegeria sp. TaxID=1879320 RepID=UPI003B5B4900
MSIAQPDKTLFPARTTGVMAARVRRAFMQAGSPDDFRCAIATLYCRAGHAERMGLMLVLADALWDAQAAPEVSA